MNGCCSHQRQPLCEGEPLISELREGSRRNLAPPRSTVVESCILSRMGNMSRSHAHLRPEYNIMTGPFWSNLADNSVRKPGPCCRCSVNFFLTILDDPSKDIRKHYCEMRKNGAFVSRRFLTALLDPLLQRVHT